MNSMRLWLGCLCLSVLCAHGQAPIPLRTTPLVAKRWANGPSVHENYFPIAVWLQNTKNAARYKEAGINLYVGLWRGPTAEQLADLEKVGVKVICGQNRGLAFKDNPTIVGWMHNDEPDNAQSLGQGKGYGPPVSTEQIVQDYARLREADPTRPVFLNLGQGVAWDNYIGRGVRRNHPEDYPEYLKGCDIGSYDIYPVVHDSPQIAGKLETVPFGVERMVKWTSGQKTIWNCIEAAHISNPKVKATPEQVRAQVWMSLIHGSQGIIYFVHQFEPKFSEASLLEDPVLLAGVTTLNQEIHQLAPALNSRTKNEGVTVNSSTTEVPIAWMRKEHGSTNYLFSVAMRNQPTRGTFKIPGLAANAEVEVIGEARKLSAKNGGFADEFKPYQVHLYRIAK